MQTKTLWDLPLQVQDQEIPPQSEPTEAVPKTSHTEQVEMAVYLGYGRWIPKLGPHFSFSQNEKPNGLMGGGESWVEKTLVDREYITFYQAVFRTPKLKVYPKPVRIKVDGELCYRLNFGTVSQGELYSLTWALCGSASSDIFNVLRSFLDYGLNIPVRCFES